jgi:hypothetical protein
MMANSSIARVPSMRPKVHFELCLDAHRRWTAKPYTCIDMISEYACTSLLRTCSVA